MRKPLVIGFSCFLMSCAMGPDYERPKTEVAETFRMAEMPPDAPSIANLAWWELLRDEPLQQLVRIALEENKDLQRAVASVDEFQARALGRPIGLSSRNLSTRSTIRLSGAGRSFWSPASRTHSTTISRGLYPGRSTFGDVSGARTRQREPICSRKKRIAEP